MKTQSKLKPNYVINLANQAKINNQTLTSVFKKVAIDKKMSTGSVRNFYYKTVKNYSTTPSLYKKINLPQRLIPAFIKEFSYQESLELLYHAIKGVSLNKSLRGVVYELAGGNDKLALRYQNKIRNLIKLNSPLIDEASEKVKNELGYYVDIRSYKTHKNSEFKRLEKCIDQMLRKILAKNDTTNNEIRERAIKLELENKRLKRIVKKAMIDKGFNETDKSVAK